MVTLIHYQLISVLAAFLLYVKDIQMVILEGF